MLGHPVDYLCTGSGSTVLEYYGIRIDESCNVAMMDMLIINLVEYYSFLSLNTNKLVKLHQLLTM